MRLFRNRAETSRPSNVLEQTGRASNDHTPERDRFDHIILFGINYSPELTGIAPYTTGLAEYLAGAGSTVEVFTGLPHYPSWCVPEHYRRRLRVPEPQPEHGGPKVTRLWHYVPRRQSALSRATYEATFLLTALKARPTARPHLVIAVTPALAGAAAGARHARRVGAPLLIVVQDLVAKAAHQSGISGGRSAAGVAARVERCTLQQADHLIAVSDSFIPALTAYGVRPERISVIPNWTHIAPTTTDREAARSALGWEADRFIVAHTGNMGFKQDLSTVIDAARRLPHDVQILLIGDGNQRRILEDEARDITNLRFLDPLDDDQYPLALAAADLLLVNERPSVGDMSLPSKLTSYLVAGRPILAAVSADGATKAELSQTDGASVIVPPGHPDVLARSILDLRADEAHRRQMGIAAHTYARRRLGRASALSRFDEVLYALAQRPTLSGARS